MDNLAKLPFKYESEINIISRKKNPRELITDKHSVKNFETMMFRKKKMVTGGNKMVLKKK